ncbi:MAG TPA: phosphatase PAP2 family protein [Acidothermaceae bacterium]|nr:phosphatase PAP2 family protein [Acidothermaceae bacterium]
MRNKVMGDRPTDKVMGDRPTDNRVQTVEAQRTHVRVHDDNAPASRTSLTTSRASLMHVWSSTYMRVRDLPTRTLFLITLGAYIALTAAVVFGSPLDIIDRVAAASDLAKRFPHATPWVLHYVMLGQRGPSSHVAFVYLLYRAVRQRSWRPLALFVTSLTMLNVTVGSVKLAIGRLGPSLTTHPRAVFDGGDIFPSGHTSNAVVIFGVLAMVAAEHRRAWIALAVFVCTTVGLSTIFLDTHWVTDVLGGWLAGALVMLALPRTYDLLERRALRAIHAVKQWFRPGPATRRSATWEALPHQHDLTSDMFTEDAMYR